MSKHQKRKDNGKTESTTKIIQKNSKTSKKIQSQPASSYVKKVSWPQSLINFKINPFQQVSSIIPGQIYTLPRFFSTKLCDDLIRWCETNSNLNSNSKTSKDTNGLNFITTQMPPKKDYAARVNDRAVVYDKEIARYLWGQLKPILLYDLLGLNHVTSFDAASSKRKSIEHQNSQNNEGNLYYDYENELDENAAFIREIFKSCIGLNDNIRIYRYLPGHYFGQHYDDSVKASVIPLQQIQDNGSRNFQLKDIPGETKWTLLIYLTGEDEGEVKGGETIFYQEELSGNFQSKSKKSDSEPRATKIKLEKGTLLLHKHGDDCYLHEGALVTDGVKWVFRSDLVFPM